MSLEQLTAVVEPPASPSQSPSDDDVAALEAKLGISFPRDYVEMCQTFGRGTFSSTCTGVNLILPAGRYLHHLETSQLRFSYKSHAPYTAFPESPGLLPWAWDEGDAEVYWLLESHESTLWPIITRIGEQYDPDAFQRFDMSATEFLAKAFSNEITVALWDPAKFGYDEEAAAELRREIVTFQAR